MSESFDYPAHLHPLGLDRLNEPVFILDETMNDIDRIIWHDGVLSDIKIIPDKTFSIILTAETFDSEESRSRKKIKLTFTNIDNLVCSIDSSELIDNLNAGNISNGYMKKVDDKNMYKFFSLSV